MKALLSAVLLSVLGASAFADVDHQAVVIHLGDNTCRVFDGDKNVVEVHNGLRAVTLNENNVMLTSCWGHHPDFAASDGQTKMFKGFLCSAIHPVLGRLETFETMVVVSSSGSVHLKCHFRLAK